MQVLLSWFKKGFVLEQWSLKAGDSFIQVVSYTGLTAYEHALAQRGCMDLHDTKQVITLLSIHGIYFLERQTELLGRLVL